MLVLIKRWWIRLSDSFELIRELLPLGSALQDDGNPLRIVLDRSVGEWLDGFEQPFDELFLTTASGGWLDAHGRQYGVSRRLDEDDESYRQRIVYEKLDELTPSLLVDVYGVKLFSLVDDFNVYGNSLVSDNPFLGGGGFIGVADDDVVSILDKKFILGTGVTWVSGFGELEYILNSLGVNVLSDYSRIYNLSRLYQFFEGNSSIKMVKLTLPNATNCAGMFLGCFGLVNVDLNLPNVINCENMFYDCGGLLTVDLNLPNATNCQAVFRNCGSLKSINLTLPNAVYCNRMFFNCSELVNVKLTLPNLSSYENIFGNAPKIETIDVTIPANKVSGFKSYVTGLNLQYLTSFKINGEEQL